jgi:hypothetical protein
VVVDGWNLQPVPQQAGGGRKEGRWEQSLRAKGDNDVEEEPRRRRSKYGSVRKKDEILQMVKENKEATTMTVRRPKSKPKDMALR